MKTRKNPIASIPALTALIVALVLVLPAACTSPGDTGLKRDENAVLANRSDEGEAADGIRALLLESAARATADLSRPNGYQRYDATRLPFPGAADTIVSLLRAYGYGSLADPVLADINRGVEITAGKAMPVLGNAIAQLGITDIRSVIDGGPHAATDLLCGDAPASPVRADLLREYATVLNAGLADAGYYHSLKILIDQYNSIPVLSDIAGLELEPEIRERGLDGICRRMALEEARMRDDPGARPNDAIRHLFVRPY